MSPAREPFADDFSSLNLTKQNDLTDEKLFYKDKENNIFPYLKTDICDKINVFKPCTFFPVLKELDIPFLEEKWLTIVERNIQEGIEEKDLAFWTFGKYLSWCKLHDNKNNGFKHSNKFFINWLCGWDYYRFHYIYNPNYWGFSYKEEEE